MRLHLRVVDYSHFANYLSSCNVSIAHRICIGMRFRSKTGLEMVRLWTEGCRKELPQPSFATFYSVGIQLLMRVLRGSTPALVNGLKQTVAIKDTNKVQQIFTSESGKKILLKLVSVSVALIINSKVSVKESKVLMKEVFRHFLYQIS